MKTSFKKSLFTFFAAASTVAAVATAQTPVIIYTPNGSVVPNATMGSVPTTVFDLASELSKYGISPNSIVQVGDETPDYNCHGYAWHMTESGFVVWFEDPSIYWLDYSYVPTSSPKAGDKIVYECVSLFHSGVKNDDPNYEITSKWTHGPLMKHPVGMVPYTFTNITFYTRNPSVIRPTNKPDVTGPIVVYSLPDSATFTLDNPPPGNITWIVEAPFSFKPDPNMPELTKTVGNSVSVAVYKIGAGTNEVYLTAKNSSGGIITKRRIKPDSSVSPSISGISQVCFSGDPFFLLNPPSGQPIYWTVSNTSLFTVENPNSPGNPKTIKRIGLGTGSATLSARTGSVSGTVVATKTVTTCAGPEISGDAVICNNGTPVQYTVAGGSLPLDYTWACSSNLTAGLTSDRSRYFSANSGTAGPAWVSVKNSSNVEMARFDLIITSCTSISISSGPSPSLICLTGSGSTASFSASSSLPPGYKWDCSPTLFNITGSTTGNSVTVKGGGSTGYITSCSGWVCIRNCSGVQVGMRHVWYDTPVISDITAKESYYPYGPVLTYPYILYPNVEYRFEAQYDPLSAISQFEWSHDCGNNWVGITNYPVDWKNLIFSDTYGSNVWCRAKNTCGWGSSDYFNFTLEPFYSPTSVYPNPVSDILSIEIDDQAILQAQTRGQTTSGAQRSVPDPAFDIRLYDGMGNILRQQQTKGGTVQFNVSNLPNGTYYLHIYDGASDKPEIQQIMVQH